MASKALVLTGEPVGHADSLKGYNTYGNENGKIVSAVCGHVEAVERVVSVRTASSRYLGETGDVVIGRIKEVSGSRWKVSIGSHQEAIMLLSNVTEPGGVLRRRGREDEIHMRSIFSEGDVVVCEVQRVMHDGTVSLHTRSAEKYGKMGEGLLVVVRPQLIPKTRKHFCTLTQFPSIRVILGVNGYIWLHGRGDESREDMSRIYNVLQVMNARSRVIHIDVMELMVVKSVEMGLKPWDITLPGNASALLTMKRPRQQI
eukprot:PhF_6_TR3925/c0_g1_i1/m.5501/K03679/RRP4, EXOSC2; exosome complex component RRP4